MDFMNFSDTALANSHSKTMAGQHRYPFVTDSYLCQLQRLQDSAAQTIKTLISRPGNASALSKKVKMAFSIKHTKCFSNQVLRVFKQ